MRAAATAAGCPNSEILIGGEIVRAAGDAVSSDEVHATFQCGCGYVCVLFCAVGPHGCALAGELLKLGADGIHIGADDENAHRKLTRACGELHFVCRIHETTLLVKYVDGPATITMGGRSATLAGSGMFTHGTHHGRLYGLRVLLYWLKFVASRPGYSSRQIEAARQLSPWARAAKTSDLVMPGQTEILTEIADLALAVSLAPERGEMNREWWHASVPAPPPLPRVIAPPLPRVIVPALPRYDVAAIGQIFSLESPPQQDAEPLLAGLRGSNAVAAELRDSNADVA